MRIELQNLRMSLTFSTPLPKKCECIARFLHRARKSWNVLDGSSTEFQKVWMYWAVCAWRRRRCEWIWRFAHRARKGGNVSESGDCEAGTQSLLRTASIWGGSLPGPPRGGARSRPGNQVLDLFRRTVRDIPQKSQKLRMYWTLCSSSSKMWGCL